MKYEYWCDDCGRVYKDSFLEEAYHYCEKRQKVKPLTRKPMKLKPGFKKCRDDCTGGVCLGCGGMLRNVPHFTDYKGNLWCESCATEDEWVKVVGRTTPFTCVIRIGGCGKDFPPSKAYAKNPYETGSIVCAKCAGKEEPFKQEYVGKWVSDEFGIRWYSNNVGHEYWDYDKAGKKIKSLKKGGIMSVVNKVKQLAKSKDQKLLEKYYVTNDCGELTEDGKELVLEKAFNQYKSDIVEDLKKIESEEKKK